MRYIEFIYISQNKSSLHIFMCMYIYIFIYCLLLRVVAPTYFRSIPLAISTPVQNLRYLTWASTRSNKFNSCHKTSACSISFLFSFYFISFHFIFFISFQLFFLFLLRSFIFHYLLLFSIDIMNSKE